MRPITIVLCLFAAACSDQLPGSPTPTARPTVAPAPMPAQSGTALPFRGSFTTSISAAVVPPNLLAEGTAEGTATHLGHFTATLTAVVDLATSTSTGTFDFTAANGDHVSGTFIGEGVNQAPGVAKITEVATIQGGTGRFAAASGTFTMQRIDRIDEASLTSSGSGTFEGHINLNR